MIRIAFILLAIGLIVAAVYWAWTWIRKNKVRIRINRPPTRGELFILTAVFQFIRRLIRIFLRI
ncbi:MAG TPA: hypothetical protein VLB09_02290 [Nitrospiria bacterium]|nr:hypothetical protein [Nitrospiria bacterium]